MKQILTIILMILGLGSVVTFIRLLETADMVYQVAYFFPVGPIRDFFLIITNRYYSICSEYT